MTAAAPTRLILVRHGQTDANAGGRMQGQQDVPLNDTGRRQAAAVAARLAGFEPDGIVTSDLSRAAATADAIHAATGAPLTTDPQLREIHIGSWQGKTAAQVAAENPWYTEAIRTGADFRRSETGETSHEAATRVAEALRGIAASRPGVTTVIVGHGWALRGGLCLALGLGMEAFHVLGGLWNCSWSVVDITDRWRLISYNNVVPRADADAAPTPRTPAPSPGDIA